jgi:DNA-binding response OmpR family regulator
MAQARGARAILIDDDAVTGPVNRKNLQDLGYVVALVSDLQAASVSARLAPPGVIFVNAEVGSRQGTGLIQGLKSEDSTRHVPIQFLGAPVGTRPPLKGLTSVGRSNW